MVTPATQRNSALVEESAAAAEALKAQAQHLVAAVAVFTLGAKEQDVVAPAPPVIVKAPAAWQGEERRGPKRATNVSRLAARSAPQPDPKPGNTAVAAHAGSGADEWESF